MDSTLAIIFIIPALTDMGFNDCPTGCLAQSEATARITEQIGSVIFQKDDIGDELYFGFDMDRRYGPFQPTVGGSATADGDLWAGAGVKWTTERLIDSPFFVEVSLMPGLYALGDGPDLGGALQFRSALGLGVGFDNGVTVTVLYDHRSNADTQSLNPGLETLAFRFAFPLS